MVATDAKITIIIGPFGGYAMFLHNNCAMNASCLLLQYALLGGKKVPFRFFVMSLGFERTYEHSVHCDPL